MGGGPHAGAVAVVGASGWDGGQERRPGATREAGKAEVEEFLNGGYITISGRA